MSLGITDATPAKMLRNKARSRSTSLLWISSFLSSNGPSGLLMVHILLNAGSEKNRQYSAGIRAKSWTHTIPHRATASTKKKAAFLKFLSKKPKAPKICISIRNEFHDY